MDAASNSSGPAPAPSAFNPTPAHLMPFQASALSDEMPVLGSDLTSILAQSTTPKIVNIENMFS